MTLRDCVACYDRRSAGLRRAVAVRFNLPAVIPAEAGFSTAELVMHLDFRNESKLDSRFRGNDDKKTDAAVS